VISSSKERCNTRQLDDANRPGLLATAAFVGLGTVVTTASVAGAGFGLFQLAPTAGIVSLCNGLRPGVVFGPRTNGRSTT